MTEPLVSILISVYNAGEYLLPSVQSTLSQTFSNLEILIIDDGSTDGCMASIANLKDPRMRVISQENCGKAVALNRALQELSGKFYAIQDADDISYPQRIERQVKCMLENTNLAAVFTGHDIILDGRHVAPRFAGKSIEQCHSLHLGWFLGVQIFVYNRQLLLSVLHRHGPKLIPLFVFYVLYSNEYLKNSCSDKNISIRQARPSGIVLPHARYNPNLAQLSR